MWDDEEDEYKAFEKAWRTKEKIVEGTLQLQQRVLQIGRKVCGGLVVDLSEEIVVVGWPDEEITISRETGKTVGHIAGHL